MNKDAVTLCIVTAHLTVFPVFSIPETGKNKEKVKVAKVDSECPQGRKTSFGVLQKNMC